MCGSTPVGPGAGDAGRHSKYVTELLALAPDVVLATGSGDWPLQEATRTVPIVFASATDPVGAGHVGELGAAGRQRHWLYLISNTA